MSPFCFPLDKDVYLAADTSTYARRDLHKETELPIKRHPGAFGAARRTHQHEGVDIYGLHGDPVIAMEDGVVVGKGIFTGAPVGTPWLAHTQYLMLEGESGVLNYGEIQVVPCLPVGAYVQRGDCIGWLRTVLHREGRKSCTMLHLEKYAHGTRSPLRRWELDAPRPDILQDPTHMLMQAAFKEGRLIADNYCTLLTASRSTQAANDATADLYRPEKARPEAVAA